MLLGVSRRAYARRWGVDHKTISYAVRTGVIIPLADGSIDEDQADASWGARRASRLAPLALTPEEAARMDAELAALWRGLGDLSWLTDPAGR